MNGGEVIDEMTTIIASLNSRLDELESARKLCTCGAGDGSGGSASDARHNTVVTDDVMYQGIIDTLTKQNDELTRNNEKLTGEVRELTTENIMLTRKYETLSAEYQVAVCTEYCSVCREDTHHENSFCIQCLLIEQDNLKGDTVEPAQYDIVERIHSALGVATVPIVPTDNASTDNASTDNASTDNASTDNTFADNTPTTSSADEKRGEEFSISRDKIIAGYQKVILALTHKLAEAYGVSEK